MSSEKSEARGCRCPTCEGLYVELRDAYKQAEAGMVRFNQAMLANRNAFLEDDARKVTEALDCLLNYLSGLPEDIVGELAVIYWNEP